MQLLIYSLLIVSLRFVHGWTEWTGCIDTSYIRPITDACIYACPAETNSAKTCIFNIHANNVDMCSSNANCGGVSNSCIICGCSCLNNCDFVDIVSETADKCGVNKLNEIDEEIAEQISFEVAGAMLGEIPVIGALFSVVWAAWSPFSPISSYFSLYNQITEDINRAIDDLKECIHAAISKDNINEVNSKMHALLGDYQTAAGSQGDEQINEMRYVFNEFTGDLTEIFVVPENSYEEYFGMLPVYKSLYPLYEALVIERLLYLKHTKNDNYNLNFYQSRAVAIFDILLDWISWAKPEINTLLQQKILDAHCYNEADMNNELAQWLVGFDDIYIIPVQAARHSIKAIGDNWTLEPGFCPINNIDITDEFIIEFDLTMHTWTDDGFIHIFDIGNNEEFALRYSPDSDNLYFKYTYNGNSNSIIATNRIFTSPTDDNIEIHHEMHITQTSIQWKMNDIVIVNEIKQQHETGTIGPLCVPKIGNYHSIKSANKGVLHRFRFIAGNSNGNISPNSNLDPNISPKFNDPPTFNKPSIKNEPYYNINISDKLLIVFCGIFVILLILNIFVCYNKINNNNKSTTYTKVNYGDSNTDFADYSDVNIVQ